MKNNKSSSTNNTKASNNWFILLDRVSETKEKLTQARKLDNQAEFHKLHTQIFAEQKEAEDFVNLSNYAQVNYFKE